MSSADGASLPEAATGKDTARTAYYAFDQVCGSCSFDTLDELIAHANGVVSRPVWIDVQGESPEGKRDLLARLSLGVRGRLSAAAIEEAVCPSENDVVQLQPLLASYALGVVSCASGSIMFDANNNSSVDDGSVGAGGHTGGAVDADEKATDAAGPTMYGAEAMDRGNGMVWCTFCVSEHVLVTLHSQPFIGREEMVRCIETNFAPRDGVDREASSALPRQDSSADKLALERHASLPSVPSMNDSRSVAAEDGSFGGAAAAAGHRAAFSTGYALATLVTFTSETMLPDPTALLSEVDCIDEMVLLIAPGARDQPDLLRRVALLRRRISAFRARLYLKEKLLQELVTPAMRGGFVSRDVTGALPLYKDSVGKIAQVADRLDDARDILNQANLNFVTGVSMRMSQSSANMDFKMQILGQVATICLPLNLVASIFGMNCTVPWQSDTHPSLHAFWGIVAVMAGWCVLCSIPTIRDAIHGNVAKAIVPSDN